jgi:thiamine-phosphate pyrophosphorylase
MSKAVIPRLMLVTPRVGDAEAFADALEAALQASEFAAVILRFEPADERTLLARAKILVRVVQNADAAALLEGLPDLVGKSGADGLHLTGAGPELQEAVTRFRPEKIVGTGNLQTRHEAMSAGEFGVDYLLFGEPERSDASVIERVSWWAELFEIPGVALASAPEDIAPLAATGIDFVALGDFIWLDADGPAEAVRRAAAALERQEVA